MGLYSTLDSRDIVADFYPRLEAEMENIWAAKISLTVPSDTETENYKWLGQVPALREWVGGRHEVPLNKYSMTLSNVEYEATLPIDVADLRRDKTGQLRVRVGDLARRTATHWNSLESTLISNGTAGNSGLCYDGQYFFDTDHDESGSNQSNDLTSSEVPASDVTTTAAPTATEAANIIVQTIGHIRTLTDDAGEPINQDAKRFMIMCTKGAIWAAFQNAVFQDNLGSNTVTNPVRGIQRDGYSFEVVLNSRITAADAIYMFAMDGNLPFVMQEEVPVSTQLIGEGSEEEFKNKRHLFGVSATRAAGYAWWQSAVYLPFT